MSRSGIDQSELAQVFAEVRALWNDVQQITSPEDVEEVCGQGTADDERVRVTLSADGRVRDVHVHRKSMQSSEDLGTFVREAANRAQADLRDRLAAEGSETAASTHRAVATRALQLQQDSAQRLGRMIDDLAGTMHRFSRAAGTGGDRRGR